MTAVDAALRADGVTVEYRALGRTVVGVADASVSVVAGSFVVLAGPSGSGKSSLLRTLGLLDRPTRGRVLFVGEDVSGVGARTRRRLRRRIGYVHQRPAWNLVDDFTALQQLQVARAVRGLAPTDCSETLAAFGLAHRAGQRPTMLSGGEQQRLAIAMAAAAQPVALCADEPTAELDRRHAGAVISALRAAAARGLAVVAASHDPELIAAADVVVRLREGKVVERG